jgi:phospholipid/cholesterol/gamma-HCH transport system permease protein
VSSAQGETPKKADAEPREAPKELSGPLRSAKGGVEWVGDQVIGLIEGIGGVVLMVWEVLKVVVRPPYRVRLLFESMEEVGVGALFIVLLTGLFTGMVLSLQGVYAFKAFNAETLVGGSTAVALARELSPVLTGLMVSGRSGSSMATTLGTMRVTEQIDAMDVMAVSSIQYLVAPRIIAAILMMPLLVLLFDLVGMSGAYLVAVGTLDVDGGLFMAKIKDFVAPMDLVKGGIKGGFFGAAIATLSCYRGYYASGGAKGVGEATTSAVVLSSISILVLNYILDLALW